MDLKSLIRVIPNYPKKGVMFRDVTTLLKDDEGFSVMMKRLVKRYKTMDIDAVAGIESRGFISGAVLAYELGVGFIPLRKKNKLPAPTISEEYKLEYGKATIEVHVDAISKGMKILLVDDLVATGGTALAGTKLIKRLGGVVMECSFIVNLPELGGAEKLKEAGFNVFNLLEFKKE